MQAQPSAAHVPGRRVDGGDAGPRGGRRTPPGRARSRPSTAPDAVWVAVSHGDVIKAILADALGMHLDLFQRIARRPGVGLDRALHRDRGPFVLATNTHAGDLVLAGAAGRAKKRPRAASDDADAPSVGGAGPAAGRRILGLAGMPVVHEFDPPERFVAGTVGEPGQRTFFLQARDGRPDGQRRAGEAAGRRRSPSGSTSCSTS